MRVFVKVILKLEKSNFLKCQIAFCKENFCFKEKYNKENVYAA